MDEVHPQETELAFLAEEKGDGDVADHLRWCARCRSVVADYRWLGGEIEATLSAAAAAVPVPRPRWLAVQEHLVARQRRQAVGWRVSAVASVVLAFCLMLAVSPILGTAAAARTLPPQALVAPAPWTAVGTAGLAVPTAGHAAPLATPTPAISWSGDATPAATPGFVLPPRPPSIDV